MEIIKARDVMEQPVAVQLTTTAYPNPSTNGFTLVAKGTNEKETAKIVVYNVSGKMIDAKTVVTDQLIKLGDTYRPGIYFAELIQGHRKVTIKLIKQPD
ncbi:MAG: T9SS type A sorting domain-containing protein [Flavisolibacter sp.]